jgi:copper chaperone
MREVKIKGMSCQHCAASVTDALNTVEGVSDVSVDLDSGMARFELREGADPRQVKQAVETIGFSVEEERG